MARVNLDTDITELSTSQLRSLVPSLAKTANSRLTRLRRNQIDYYAIERADRYLQSIDRRLFPTNIGSLSDNQLKILSAELQDFINAQSSTLTGLNEIRSSRIEAFRMKGLEIEDEDQFYDFLTSKQFETLKMFADSDTIIEDFDTALSEGFTIYDIMRDYDLYLRSESITFEQLQERRNKSTRLR